jgi:protein associated with RNAse G/E
VNVASTKYDGSLHYRFRTEVVTRRDTSLALYLPPGIPIESYRGPLVTSRHYLMLWWKDRPYELEVVWHPDWSPEMHYFNIGCGFEWNDESLQWVDLDLDVIWRFGKDPIVDDVDEFDDHKVAWQYPPSLEAECLDAVTAIRSSIADRVSPLFDETLYRWRPGSPVAIS